MRFFIILVAMLCCAPSFASEPKRDLQGIRLGEDLSDAIRKAGVDCSTISVFALCEEKGIREIRIVGTETIKPPVVKSVSVRFCSSDTHFNVIKSVKSAFGIDGDLYPFPRSMLRTPEKLPSETLKQPVMLPGNVRLLFLREPSMPCEGIATDRLGAYEVYIQDTEIARADKEALEASKKKGVPTPEL